MNKYFTITDIECKALKDERAIMHYISTNDIDRVKDIMIPSGMDSADFEKTRTVFFNHNYNQPVARNETLSIDSKGVLAKTVFAKDKFSDDVYNWHLEKIVNTWSIGFTAESKDVRENKGIWTYEKWKLLEYSSAPLPANPNALDIAKTMTKSIEGIAMIDSSLKYAEFNSILELQNKELTEIKDLIKNINKTDNKDIQEEIRKEFNKEIEEIKNLIKLNSEVFNKSITGVNGNYNDLLNKIKQLDTKKLNDIELARIITGEVMTGVNSQIAKAFLMVTGKEIKLN